LPSSKERQLALTLTRELAEAQFVRGDRLRSELLWQEVAAEGMDPERIIALLYRVHDREDSVALDEVDRPYRTQRRQVDRRFRSSPGRLAGLRRRF